jgi:4-diphosphocytidyl-2C-methyl-D-erythritol kinase
MSGIITAIVVAGGTSIYQGEQQRKAQKKSLRSQKMAQAESQARASSTAKQSLMAEAKANRKKPNIATLLGRERMAANRGPGSTMMTGTGGARGTMLGGGSSLMGVGGY